MLCSGNFILFESGIATYVQKTIMHYAKCFKCSEHHLTTEVVATIYSPKFSCPIDIQSCVTTRKSAQSVLNKALGTDKQVLCFVTESKLVLLTA